MCIAAYNEETSNNITLKEMENEFFDWGADLLAYVSWFYSGGDSAGIDLCEKVKKEIGEEEFAKMTIEQLEKYLNER